MSTHRFNFSGPSLHQLSMTFVARFDEFEATSGNSVKSLYDGRNASPRSLDKSLKFPAMPNWHGTCERYA
jgi:hypothetical protein